MNETTVGSKQNLDLVMQLCTHSVHIVPGIESALVQNDPVRVSTDRNVKA